MGLITIWRVNSLLDTIIKSKASLYCLSDKEDIKKFIGHCTYSGTACGKKYNNIYITIDESFSIYLDKDNGMTTGVKCVLNSGSRDGYQCGAWDNSVIDFLKYIVNILDQKSREIEDEKKKDAETFSSNFIS